jgi:hypothetical protein
LPIRWQSVQQLSEQPESSARTTVTDLSLLAFELPESPATARSLNA